MDHPHQTWWRVAHRQHPILISAMTDGEYDQGFLHKVFMMHRVEGCRDGPVLLTRGSVRDYDGIPNVRYSDPITQKHGHVAPLR